MEINATSDAAMTGPTIEAVDLHKTFGSRKHHDAVRGVSLAVNPGECLAIMGASGSGKSTLLYMLGALLTPTSGDVRICGTALRETSRAERARLRRHCVGFVFQSFNLVPVLTVRENVMLPAVLARSSRPEVRHRAGELISVLGLQHLEDKFPAELSGGEQQRCAIARALLARPQVVLADEPTGNLDSQTGSTVLTVLRQVQSTEGCALVLVTHDYRVAAVADSVIRLRDGKADATLALGLPSGSTRRRALKADERAAAVLAWNEEVESGAPNATSDADSG